MEIKYKKLQDLKPAEYNPRKMTEKEAKDLRESIKRFGLAEPIVVNIYPGRENIIVGGHQRFYIAKELAYNEIPCVEVSLPFEKETELNLRLNKNLGSWDWDLLANLDEALLLEVGFENEELDENFDLNEGEAEDDEIPEVKETDIRPGDLFQIGQHILLCGSALNKEDVLKLMDGKKADMVFTDPPYRLASEKFGAEGDRQYASQDSSKVFQFDEWLKNIPEIAAEKFRIFVWENWVNTKDLWLALEKYWKPGGMIIWYATNRRNNFINPNNGLFNRYDIGLLATQGDKKFGYSTKSPEDLIVETVERESRTGQSTVFGVKPIEILVPYLSMYCERKGIVLDLFGGSGSTMIAAEKVERICYMMELEPTHCQVIIDRFEKWSGQKAIKL